MTRPDGRATILPNGVPATVPMPDGWPIRVVDWPAPAQSNGSLLFLNGRADFIEKYGEAYHAFASWGLALSAFDWRGQGGSGRLGAHPHHGHGDDFDRWVDDLDALVARFVARAPAPHFAVGHSMGGHLLLRHLARGNSPLARVALLAPMLGLRAAPPAVRRLARLMTALGAGDRFAPLQRPYGKFQQRPERANLLTGSPERFAEEHDWLARRPELALGGVTWGWLAAADRSLATLLAPGLLESIATPTLTLVGERERLVDSTPARRLPGACVVIPGGRHELLRDADAPRLDTLARLKAWLLV